VADARHGAHGRLGVDVNRAQRRHPEQGGQPVTVSREVPMSVIVGGDGSRQVVNHDTDEPCFSCPCCALWSRNLDTLAGAMREHATEPAGADPDALCLVCQMLAGGANTPDVKAG
jgi:hypothetical protein